MVRLAAIAVAALALSSITQAQERDEGWEVGLDVVYQDHSKLDFNGGTTVDLNTDVGLSLTFGYRISSQLELQFALDWSNVGYSANLIPQTGPSVGVDGSYQAFTPRANVQWNFMDGPITPFVMGGVGYSFIDTNIPNGRPSTGCWWDPWYGYICTSVQPTKSVDSFVYQIGAGVRWDVSDYTSARFAIENHWIDFGGNGTASTIQAKLGFAYRFDY
jgi:opacity protein-like surface antigen